VSEIVDIRLRQRRSHKLCQEFNGHFHIFSHQQAIYNTEYFTEISAFLYNIEKFLNIKISS